MTSNAEESLATILRWAGIADPVRELVSLLLEELAVRLLLAGTLPRRRGRGRLVHRRPP